MLRYRCSWGRTELADHQNTKKFEDNSNSTVPRAGLGGFEKSKKWWIFPRAKRAANLCAERFKKNIFGRARSAPLTFVLKSQKNIVPRAKRAVYAELVEHMSSENGF